MERILVWRQKTWQELPLGLLWLADTQRDWVYRLHVLLHTWGVVETPVSPQVR